MATPKKKEKTVKPEAKAAALTSSSRVRREVTRLNKIFAARNHEEKEYLAGLIKRAAWMKVQLEDMEKDLEQNGLTEMFTQSENAPPYERERPKARLYNSINKNYQTIMKQLADFLARSDTSSKPPDDGFEDFCNS